MDAPQGKIYFHYLVNRFDLRERSALKGFILDELLKSGRKVETINYVFCDDDYLLQMNRDYLKHDTLTDIITFEFSPKPQPLLADIYISWPRVKENAAVFGVSFRRELHRVIFHGALHLLGFKDKTGEQAQQMRGMEEEWLRRYFSRGTSVSRKD